MSLCGCRVRWVVMSFRVLQSRSSSSCLLSSLPCLLHACITCTTQLLIAWIVFPQFSFDFSILRTLVVNSTEVCFSLDDVWRLLPAAHLGTCNSLLDSALWWCFCLTMWALQCGLLFLCLLSVLHISLGRIPFRCQCWISVLYWVTTLTHLMTFNVVWGHSCRVGGKSLLLTWKFGILILSAWVMLA